MKKLLMMFALLAGISLAACNKEPEESTEKVEAEATESVMEESDTAADEANTETDEEGAEEAAPAQM